MIYISIANYQHTDNLQKREVVQEPEAKHVKKKKMLAELGSLDVNLLSKKEVCKLVKFFKRVSFFFLFPS